MYTYKKRLTKTFNLLLIYIYKPYIMCFINSIDTVSYSL